MYNVGVMMPWIDYASLTLNEILEKYSAKSLDKSKIYAIIQTVNGAIQKNTVDRPFDCVLITIQKLMKENLK